VRLNSLHLVNFRQHADTRIAFETGLTGIIGVNGSGKTTILEGIAWALYGNSAARGTRESIRFSRAAARAAVRVELDFDLGGHRYRVVRGLTNAELYLDGASSPIANSITGVGELLERRLGMTRGEFFNTYFTGQKELNVMAAMGPSERARFLSRVLGYEKLRVAQDLVRERRKLLVAEAAGLRSGMPDADTVRQAVAAAHDRLAAAVVAADAAAGRVAAARAALDLALPEWERAQGERELWQGLEGERKLTEHDADRLAADAERNARELGDLAVARAELDRLRQELATFDASVRDLQHADGLYREDGRRRSLLDHERSIGEELGVIAARIGRLESAPALEAETAAELAGRRRELAEVEAHAEARRTEWVRDQQEAATRLQALRTQYTELRAQRDRLVAAGADGECPTCARPLGGHFGSVMALLEEQASTVEVDGKYYKQRVEQMEQPPPELTALEERRRTLVADSSALERRLAKAQAAGQELVGLRREAEAKAGRRAQIAGEIGAIPAGYDAAAHARLRAEVDRLAPLDARAARLGAAVDRAPHLTRERDRIAADRVAVAARLADVQVRQAAVRFDERQHAEIRTRWTLAAAALRDAELADVATRGDREAARVAVASAEAASAALAAVEARLEGLQRDRRLHDELDRAYTDLRTELNFQLRPELSELASGFLADLTDGRYTELELDDQYNIVVLEDGVPKPVISGGEEDMANLVLRLAISQMIAERAGQPFTLLILDEVFGSLDETRRHNVVDLLRRLQDRFEQVIVITHIEAVREGLDRVLMVRFDDARGVSTVEAGAGGASGDAGPGGEGVGLTGGSPGLPAGAAWAGAA
jgi:exonuclease SbcC